MLRSGIMLPLRPHGGAEDRERALQMALARYRSDCGCDTGAIGAIAGLIAAVSAEVWDTDVLTFIGACRALGAILVGVIAGAVLGKLFGLIRARRRLQRTLALHAVRE